MIIRQLTLRNYKQYTSLDLTFEEGLVGIIGRNGAGKSTIFEAVLYCLFGKETQQGTKNFARSTYAADETAPVELKLSFLIGQMEYEVQRSFRGRTLTAYADLYRNDSFSSTGAVSSAAYVERAKFFVPCWVSL
ncbi:MAG: AAA family ATPase, partial [Bacteroidota bacterium]